MTLATIKDKCSKCAANTDGNPKADCVFNGAMVYDLYLTSGHVIREVTHRGCKLIDHSLSGVVLEFYDTFKCTEIRDYQINAEDVQALAEWD